MIEYISLEINDKSHIISQRQAGSKDKYRSIATCRSRYQAENLVKLLNKEDISMGLVKEFHKAFNLRSFMFTHKGIPGVALTQLKKISESLLLCGRTLRETAKGVDNNLVIRVQLMVEELGEIVEAMVRGDAADVLHELADLRYTVDGTADALGFGNTLLEAVKLIHAANMTKLDKDGKPIIDESGRVVKSPLFKKANVGELLK